MFGAPRWPERRASVAREVCAPTRPPRLAGASGRMAVRLRRGEDCMYLRNTMSTSVPAVSPSRISKVVAKAAIRARPTPRPGLSSRGTNPMPCVATRQRGWTRRRCWRGRGHHQEPTSLRSCASTRLLIASDGASRRFASAGRRLRRPRRRRRRVRNKGPRRPQRLDPIAWSTLTAWWRFPTASSSSAPSNPAGARCVLRQQHRPAYRSGTADQSVAHRSVECEASAFCGRSALAPTRTTTVGTAGRGEFPSW